MISSMFAGVKIALYLGVFITMIFGLIGKGFLTLKDMKKNKFLKFVEIVIILLSTLVFLALLVFVSILASDGGINLSMFISFSVMMYFILKINNDRYDMMLEEFYDEETDYKGGFVKESLVISVILMILFSMTHLLHVLISNIF